ncbi:hypothetical protein FISHEDRAFT_52989 [Fistulina hepatica ATCC 64428]|nr:hypothetical protein FISHEDRAFT_52989 [Fistulina hepatica ATCC 64428]
MANPRQRRKAKSSSYKPVSHSRRAKAALKKIPPIRGSKLLQEAWDKKKTVRQNYERLGLIHNLNAHASGGAEPAENVHVSDTPPPTRPDAAGSWSNAAPATIPAGYGKIIRDEAGNIARVELPDEADASREESASEPEALPEPVLDRAVKLQWVSGLGHQGSRVSSSDSHLESFATHAKGDMCTLSMSISGVGQRHTSTGERAYLERLRAKYGLDFERMARDRKLNTSQYTASQLRKAFTRAGMAQ